MWPGLRVGSIWQLVVETKLFGFGKVCGVDYVFKLLIECCLVDEDEEFQCCSVISRHSQDVKMVIWHPKEDVCIASGLFKRGRNRHF